MPTMNDKLTMSSRRGVATRNRILDGAIAGFAQFSQYVEWSTRNFISLLTVPSPMMKNGIEMRQFLKSFLVPSLIEDE